MLAEWSIDRDVFNQEEVVIMRRCQSRQQLTVVGWHRTTALLRQ